MKNRPISTVIPIAFRAADRDLLNAAAELLGKPLSTAIRESAVEVARLVLDLEEPQ